MFGHRDLCKRSMLKRVLGVAIDSGGEIVTHTGVCCSGAFVSHRLIKWTHFICACVWSVGFAITVCFCKNHVIVYSSCTWSAAGHCLSNCGVRVQLVACLSSVAILYTMVLSSDELIGIGWGRAFWDRQNRSFLSPYSCNTWIPGCQYVTY